MSLLFLLFCKCVFQPILTQGERLHSHALTLAARGELHFNELLILVLRGSNNNRLDEYLCSLFEVQETQERGGDCCGKPVYRFTQKWLMPVRPTAPSASL